MASIEDNPHLPNEVHRRCPNDIKSVIKLQKDEKRRVLGITDSDQAMMQKNQTK